MSTPDAGTVELTISGAIATVRLNRPRYHNALTWSMYDALCRSVQELADIASVRVVVLRGAGGRAFAAGTDIDQFIDFDGQAGVAYEQRVDAVVTALIRLPKPTIAAIDGFAVGGGLILAAACDLRYSNSQAQLGVPIAKTLGNCLSLANWRRLAQLIGTARTLELLYTGRLIGAAEAIQWGLLNQVFPDDEFDRRVHEMAQAIADNAPLTLWASKIARIRLEEQAINHIDHTIDFDDVLAAVYSSDDFHRAVRAHRGPERPPWRGR